MENLSNEELYEKAMVVRDKSSFNDDEGDYYARKYKEYKQEIFDRLNRLAEAERENKEWVELFNQMKDLGVERDNALVAYEGLKCCANCGLRNLNVCKKPVGKDGDSWRSINSVCGDWQSDNLTITQREDRK